MSISELRAIYSDSADPGEFARAVIHQAYTETEHHPRLMQPPDRISRSGLWKTGKFTRKSSIDNLSDAEMESINKEISTIQRKLTDTNALTRNARALRKCLNALLDEAPSVAALKTGLLSIEGKLKGPHGVALKEKHGDKISAVLKLYPNHPNTPQVKAAFEHLQSGASSSA